jgi:hypothetical protein
LAWYHGVMVLLHPQEMQSAFWVQEENWILFGSFWGFLLGFSTFEWFVNLWRRFVFEWCLVWSIRSSGILATLYMAVNEIRASAKETGMQFWEYGIHISYHLID